MEAELNRLILIGGSAGGLEAATRVVAELEDDLPAAVVLVLHMGDGPASSIAKTLAKAGSLPATLVTDGEPIQAGRIYLAPPDHHAVLQTDGIYLTRGPRVNRVRPAIDLTFRSGAVAYGPQTIGVLLSGMLDDGVAGLDAIKRCGGVTVVQDPADALYPEMPESAILHGLPDHTLPAPAIGSVLNRLIRTTAAASKADIPDDIMVENRFDLNRKDDLREMDRLGSQVPLSCPECGGPLWEIEQNGSARYRCHIGHSLTTRILQRQQDEAIESTLWVAFRTLEEKARMQERLTRREKEAGRHRSAEAFQQRAVETQDQAEQLRKLLLELGQAHYSQELVESAR